MASEKKKAKNKEYGDAYLTNIGPHHRPWGFTLRPVIFEIQDCWKSEMHPMTQNDLKHLTVESTLYTLNTHPKAQISIRFSLRPAIFEIQGCWKLETHRMTPEWP